MANTEIIKQDMSPAAEAIIDLPADTHIVYSSQADVLNNALLDGFFKHQHDPDIKRSHLFNGRYENIYLTSGQIPELGDLLDEARSVVINTLDELPIEVKTDLPEMKAEVHRALRRFFNKKLDRRPVILPVIINL